MSTRYQLVECGDHKLAPWCVICVHLMTGSSQEWVPVPIEDEASEVEFDWLCPQCNAKGDDLDVDDLKCICIHCVRELRGENDDEP